MNPDAVLKSLMEGNERFVQGALQHPNRCNESKEKTSSGQSPKAIILGCSDSRVPVEIVFDQGIGDLFVIRVAGNVLGDPQMESILFALEAFGPTLVVVLGHENCGAITAARSGAIGGIPSIAKCLSPNVGGAASVHDAVVENVAHVVSELEKVENVKALVNDNQLKVVGGVYELTTGKVTFLS